LRKQSSILSEKLGDFIPNKANPHPASTRLPEALSLNPSPQQRIRVTLELGESFRALNREEETYDFYVGSLKYSPITQAKRDIVQRLVPLARKMNKNADAEKYEPS